MNITPKFEFVSGSFDTDTCEMVCVPMWKYRTVKLCIHSDGWNIPIGEIKLYDSDLFKDADLTFNDAASLGNEIAYRWNKNKTDVF